MADQRMGSHRLDVYLRYNGRTLDAVGRRELTSRQAKRVRQKQRRGLDRAKVVKDA